MRSIAEIAGCLDHTLLKPDATANAIGQLCREAQECGFIAVCVNSVWVEVGARWLNGTPVRVCSVVGFPLGATLTEIKRDEAARAIDLGAREIDMVMHIGALKGGDAAAVERDIAAVVYVCQRAAVLCKVILETALLTDDEKVLACRIARGVGADFVKTSTGFGPGGATVADVALMRRTVGDALGVKASGGIRDLRTLEAMLDAGATRIGTSAGVAIIHEARAAGRPER